MQKSSRLWPATLLVLSGSLATYALLPARGEAQPVEGGIPPPVQPGAEPARPGVPPQPGQPVRPGTLPALPGGATAPQPGGGPMLPSASGPRYTVVESQGVNLLVVDNTSNTLYFYTCDQNKEAGSDLRLRGSIDLNQVGQAVIRPKGQPAEQPNQPTRTAPPTQPPTATRPPASPPDK